jgi:ABC-type branched-subunit amino acid transport system substrate-binding protein
MKRKESVAIGVAVVVITLLLGSLLVVAGCGGDETTTTAAETSTSEAASTESTAPTETTAPSEGEVTTWLPSGLSGTPASGEPFKLGIVQAVTGWAAGGEVPSWDAYPFVIEEYNKAGGFMGRPIEIQQKDMQSDPALSPAVTQELVDWGAQAFVAPAFPGMIAGVVQVASKNGLPVISALCTTPSATWVGGAPCYLSAYGDPAMAAAMAEYALGDGAQMQSTPKGWPSTSARPSSTGAARSWAPTPSPSGRRTSPPR